MRGVERAGLVACAVVGVASAVIAAGDLVKFGGLLLAQLQGPAQGTDFLNLYAGAYLTIHAPSQVYDLDGSWPCSRA